MVNDVFLKRKVERLQPNVYISNYSRKVICIFWGFRECEPIWMIRGPHQNISILVVQTRNGMNSSPGRFLDKNDVEVELCFKDYVNN